MLKNLEIINELHERLIEKGLNFYRDKHYMGYNKTQPYTIYHCLIRLSLIQADFSRIANRDIIKYHEKQSINKILNKVDEWMER